MVEAIGAVIAAVLRIGVPIYLAAFIAAGLLLFLPDSVTSTLGLLEFRHAYRGYLGATFITSISLLLGSWLFAIVAFINDRLDARRSRRRTLERLRSLTNPEKKFLRPFIFDGENTLHAPLSDGLTGGLAANQIIYRSSTVFEHFLAPYNLQPLARKLLSDNPDLLD